MDRQIIYPGQIAVETDLLHTNRNTMISIGKLAGALFGTGGVTNGLVVGPSSPAALTVDVAPGEIYQLENVDNTDYSSLPADTTDAILKQGIMLAKQTLACAAPATAGYSINYLIQATYQDSDTGAVALPYYNASNPTQAYSGPNNTGATQATKRAGIVVVNAKAGTAATTGTQTTPAADSGYIALASVTVANGQATITSGNITAIAPASPPMVDTSAIYADLASTATGKGAALVGFLQSGTGAIGRMVQDKLRERVSVKDFGAKGDGATDDTAAFVAALAAASGGSRKLFIPAGTYMIGTLSFSNTETTLPMVIEGEGQYASILKKNVVDANPLLQLGSPTATAFSGNIHIKGLQFLSSAPTVPAGIAMYDVVASHFENCRFTGFAAGVYSYGGITNQFDRCRFDNNTFGARFTYFSSLAGGGHPNNIQINACTITLNVTTGLTIDGGRAITLTDCDIESNGAVKGTDTGGVYVGPNMGIAVDGTGLHAGVTIRGCWIEGNKGKSAVRFDSGRNRIIDTYLVPYSSAYVDNDIYVTGGVYQLTCVQSETALSPNLLESGLSQAGNYITNCTIPNLGSYNTALTTVVGSGRTIARGGEMPVVLGSASPLIQSGTATLSAGTFSVTFTKAFSTTPDIVVLPLDGTAGVSDTFRVSTRSATGFTLKGETTATGSSTQTAGAFSFCWIAVGAG